MKMGAMLSVAWEEDPKRLAFTFARYKFVAKMFNGMSDVLEVGCGDSTGSWIVAQHVGRLAAIDKDEKLLKTSPCAHGLGGMEITLEKHDITRAPYGGDFDGVYAVDVLEHVHPEDEDAFLSNVRACLKERGACIIGMPSLESQVYASGRSKRGHVNCKTEEGLRMAMQRYFPRVFIFGMNDETLHTGFGPMCHYRFALGVK